MAEFLGVLLLIVAGFAFVGVTLFIASLVRPSKPSHEKTMSYECGENPVGNAWVQFNIRFYVFALAFIIFDVEAVFLFPWAVVFKDLGLFVSVQDPEDCEEVFYRGQNLAKAWEEAQCMDFIAVEFYKSDQYDENSYAGWALFVHGHEPDETLSDHGAGPASQWINDWWDATKGGQL